MEVVPAGDRDSLSLDIVAEAVHRLTPDSAGGVEVLEGVSPGAFVPFLRPGFAGVFKDVHGRKENLGVAPHGLDPVELVTGALGAVEDIQVAVAEPLEYMVPAQVDVTVDEILAGFEKGGGHSGE